MRRECSYCQGIFLHTRRDSIGLSTANLYQNHQEARDTCGTGDCRLYRGPLYLTDEVAGGADNEGSSIGSNIAEGVAEVILQPSIAHTSGGGGGGNDRGWNDEDKEKNKKKRNGGMRR